MDRPLILYLHGFCSSPASWKARLLAEALAQQGRAADFACPQLSTVPNEALAQGTDIVRNAGRPVTLIGSSLGGHYAQVLAERHALPAVLINPATVDRLDLTQFIGEQRQFHSGERFCFTPEHATQLRAQVCPPTPSRYWLLIEQGDEVLDYRQAVDFYAGCRQSCLPGGDHSFTRFPDFIPQILEFAGIQPEL